MDRRNFIKTVASGAAALSFPTIVPASVLGDTAPSKRVTLAAIGVGRRGFALCGKLFATLKDARILAVADCFQSRRDTFARGVNTLYGGNVCRAYADFREVLARDDIDGVVICTPDHWHVPVAMAAVEAGKDVYVEKPLSVSMAWSRPLRETLARNGVVFQYGTQQRSGLAARTAVDLVQNGYVGNIERVEVWSPWLEEDPSYSTKQTPPPDTLDYDLWLGPAPIKPYSEARVSVRGATHIYDYSLGYIAGWGAHPLDILQWVLNRDDTSPVHCEGTGQLPPEGSLYDTIRSWDLALKYADGLPLRFMSANVAEPIVRGYHAAWKTNGTTFHGDEGWVSYSRGACYMSRNGQRVNTSRIDFKETDKRAYVSDSHPQNFVDCMRTRKPTIGPFESAIRSDAISHMSDLCLRTGRAIKWDPVTERIVGDPEAATLLDRPRRALRPFA